MNKLKKLSLILLLGASGVLVASAPDRPEETTRSATNTVVDPDKAAKAAERKKALELKAQKKPAEDGVPAATEGLLGSGKGKKLQEPVGTGDGTDDSTAKAPPPPTGTDDGTGDGSAKKPLYTVQELRKQEREKALAEKAEKAKQLREAATIKTAEQLDAEREKAELTKSESERLAREKAATEKAELERLAREREAESIRKAVDEARSKIDPLAELGRLAAENHGVHGDHLVRHIDQIASGDIDPTALPADKTHYATASVEKLAAELVAARQEVNHSAELAAQLGATLTKLERDKLDGDRRLATVEGELEAARELTEEKSFTIRGLAALLDALPAKELQEVITLIMDDGDLKDLEELKELIAKKA